CLTVMSINTHVITFKKIINKTYNIWMAAIAYDGYFLAGCPHEIQTYEMCELAVKYNGYILKSVKPEFQDINMCITAIRNPTYNYFGKDFDMNDTKRLDHIASPEMKEQCKKYLGDNIRFMHTKSSKI